MYSEPIDMYTKRFGSSISHQYIFFIIDEINVKEEN